jgi:hypothetical protein
MTFLHTKFSMMLNCIYSNKKKGIKSEESDQVFESPSLVLLQRSEGKVP